MSEIRRTSPDDGSWKEQLNNLFSRGISEISDIDLHEEVAESMLTSEYDFEGQPILSGSFSYTKRHPFSGNDRVHTGHFMYRSWSRLFLIETDGSPEVEQEVMEKVASKLFTETDLSVYPGIDTSKEEIWDFIEAADSKGDITVLVDGETKDYRELEVPRKELRRYIVWDAELFFRDPQTGNDQLVIYSDETITVPGRQLGSIESIIQIFEQKLFS